MNRPPPTTPVFITQLRSLPLHSKVRFLGCVNHYDVKTGRLGLEHKYPPLQSTKRDSANIERDLVNTKVCVDIYHVLNTIKADDLQVGAWLNVIGYVRSEPQTDSNEDDRKGRDLVDQIYVEAIMIHNAGAIDVGEYEQVLANMQEIKQRFDPPQ
ncbi:CST complex subunit Ten1 [Talaromyces proteolyticus]|uniref:CST complex subunit Ten1 n=1 Tax=Talaromyces proteolyticus TaxID=1131652 RepID=A0AAD4KVK2_9EURO|nr:CST complex subunit Ten1 [Talaromyces proteolyticus]KAH8697089.1 CST complex subunit Ten1 [Talaromyces proteolyticus]